MRTIDADALLQTVSIKSVFGNDVNVMKCGELRKILEMIKDAPTIEPQRIKGRWIKADTHNYLFFRNDRVYKCSNCGNLLDFEGVNVGRGDTKYCPNCGAWMEETEWQ